MAEPLFDPSLKKRKKKAVTFTEDPLGPDADPTTLPPEVIEATTVNGDVVDLGPQTAHEAMKAGQEKKKIDDDDEFKAMFGDLKKKKKKKEIPLDLVRPPKVHQFPFLTASSLQGEDSGASTPTTAPTDVPQVTSEDLDFSDMKKKKKSSKKKAAFDMEAFEKELNESKKDSGEGGKAKKGDDEDEDEDAPVDTSHLDQVDETELGDNPFSRPDVPISVDAGTEAWLTSDRDYTYPEVRPTQIFDYSNLNYFISSSHVSTPLSTQQTPHSSPPPQNDIQSHLHPSTKKVTKRPSSQTSPISAEKCIVRFVLPPILSYLSRL